MEGTKAHEVLEAIVRSGKALLPVSVPRVMVDCGFEAAKHIWRLSKGKTLLIEQRVFLDFIHPEAFGSLDYAVVEPYGTLDILDYKYGKSLVSPKENLQFIFYALAVAYKYHWNFDRVRMWTMQPRVQGFDGYSFWNISTRELMDYVPKFEQAIDRVERFPDKYVEGDWCWFCKAKSICPLKEQKKLIEAVTVFGKGKSNGDDEEINFKSEADWKKESNKKKNNSKKVK